MTESLSEHVEENMRHWNDMAHEWIPMGERAWASDPAWGSWHVPNADVPLLPDDMTGMDAIELGCGTGYISAWMTRRGARVTAVDISEGQLSTARRLASEHKLDIDFILGNAEAVPRPDSSYDFAVSEYGAVLWCDPDEWIPEAFRLLRPQAARWVYTPVYLGLGWVAVAFAGDFARATGTMVLLLIALGGALVGLSRRRREA